MNAFIPILINESSSMVSMFINDIGKVIMSQSLSEPLPLDWELLKCFSFLLPTLLGGTGCLDWAGVG